MNSAPQLRTLLILGRVSNLPTVWSNCLAGWWLGGGGNFWKLPFLLLGISLLYTGGMFLNDAFDEEFDRQRRAERPIPTGKISASLVWRLGFGQLRAVDTDRKGYIARRQLNAQTHYYLLASFDLFIKIYSFTYLGIALILLVYLIAKGYIHLTFTTSIVTKKFFKKILVFVSFIYGGALLYNISLVFDSLVIAAVVKEGLAAVAIYSLAQNIASLIQAPQRGIISSSIAALSQAWKDKDMARIERIYKQSSINQLIFAVAMFALIWLNFSDGVFTFKMQKGYLDAKWIFFFIGLYRIVDMGTGVSSQIIGTSTRWRFEFSTGIILLAITLPLNYILTKYYYGILGPAIANLVSFSIYNGIRYWFLKTKYNFQPFTKHTVYTLLLGTVCFIVCYLLFDKQQGFLWIAVRSLCFILLYISGALLLKLSSDISPVGYTILKRMGIKKGE